MFDENSSHQRKEAFPVKRISRERSRRNIVCRRRRVAARHKQSGHWTAQERPMFSSGRVHYEVSASTDAMSFGGISAIHRLVTKLGLPEELNERLPLLKVHLPYHESDHVLNLAYNVLMASAPGRCATPRGASRYTRPLVSAPRIGAGWSSCAGTSFVPRWPRVDCGSSMQRHWSLP